MLEKLCTMSNAEFALRAGSMKRSKQGSVLQSLSCGLLVGIPQLLQLVRLGGPAPSFASCVQCGMEPSARQWTASSGCTRWVLVVFVYLALAAPFILQGRTEPTDSFGRIKLQMKSPKTVFYFFWGSRRTRPRRGLYLKSCRSLDTLCRAESCNISGQG